MRNDKTNLVASGNAHAAKILSRGSCGVHEKAARAGKQRFASFFKIQELKGKEEKFFLGNLKKKNRNLKQINQCKWKRWQVEGLAWPL